MKNSIMMRLAATAAVFLLSANAARAGEKTLMHCFAWTSIKEATPADWEAFFKASDALPSKIKGINKIWYGKLTAPLGQTTVTKIDPDNLKKLRAGETAIGEVSRTPRDWGMCMEMTGAAAREAYASDPYHKVWTDAYAKIRVDGTTTFDILGQ
jgi:hypothetical protein